jgi:hypothetical protein
VSNLVNFFKVSKIGQRRDSRGSNLPALLPAFLFVTGYRRSMESFFFKVALLVTAVASIGG